MAFRFNDQNGWRLITFRWLDRLALVHFVNVRVGKKASGVGWTECDTARQQDLGGTCLFAVRERPCGWIDRACGHVCPLTFIINVDEYEGSRPGGIQDHTMRSVEIVRACVTAVGELPRGWVHRTLDHLVV